MDVLEFQASPNTSVSESLCESFEQAYPLLADAFSDEEPPDRIEVALEAERTRGKAREVETLRRCRSRIPSAPDGHAETASRGAHR